MAPLFKSVAFLAAVTGCVAEHAFNTTVSIQGPPSTTIVTRVVTVEITREPFATLMPEPTPTHTTYTTVTENLVSQLASPEPTYASPPVPSASRVVEVVYIDVDTSSDALKKAAEEAHKYSNETRGPYSNPKPFPVRPQKGSWIPLHIFNSKAVDIPLFYGIGDPTYHPWSDGSNIDKEYLYSGQYTTLWLEFGYFGMFSLDGGGKEGSKIEVSFTRDMPHIDVSYVDGYTHEITCSCGFDQVPVTGCNKDLWELNACPHSMQSGYCENPTKMTQFYGPAHPFFAPCQGSAYTFPKDDKADVGCNQATELVCCVGPHCPTPRNQLA